MRSLLVALALFGLAPTPMAGQQPAPPPAPAVKAGQQAPAFTLRYLEKTPDGKAYAYMFSHTLASLILVDGL